MEKVKDFLYDISDLFFSLLIIGIIFFVVSWKLTDTMSVSWFSNLGDTPQLEFQDITTPTDEIVIVDEPVIEEVVVDEPVEEPAEEVIVEIVEIDFEVSSGSTGYSIAKDLEEQGIIENKDDFLAKLAELELGNKLRSGTFKLNTGMTITEIINKLAGK